MLTPLISHAADNGFPSDHMLLAMSLAAVAFVWNRQVGGVLAVLAVLPGSARVLAGVHHWLDIGGSVVIAVLGVAIIVKCVA